MAKRNRKQNRVGTRSAKKGTKLLTVLVVVAGIAAVAVTVFLMSGRQTVPGPPAQVTSTDFQPLKGRWLRPDGGYVLEIRNIEPDGRMDARYFNPRPINISRAEVSRQGQKASVFVELRDAGYPGCTYTLLYDPREDSLKGVYYQAAIQESYDIVFVRMR